MSMKPMIIVGCGGSGGKIVQLLRRELELQLRRKGWTEGIPKAWQLIYVDTPSTQEQGISGVETVPLGDYVSVSGGFDLYGDVVTSIFNSYPGLENRFSGWLPGREVGVPLTDGAGQMRAVGRATAFSSMGQLSTRLQSAYAATVDNSAELAQMYNALYPGAEPASPLAVDQKPYIFVISSLAGGTGAGIFMDVCDVFRACDDDLSNRISGVLFTAEVFENLTNDSGLQPNSLAALSEIMSGYFDHHRPLEPLYAREMPLATSHAGVSGPSYPYVVGTRTMAGTKLPEIMDCYRATTQTLATVMMNPKDIGEHFTTYVMTNWAQRQSDHRVAWTFGNQSPINELKAVFSSFGSSTLSLGLRRMEEYAIQRAARTVIDFQNHGWVALGHDAMQQPQASSEEVVEFLKQRHGPAFVSDCELLEKDDDDGSNDQIIDQLLSKEELDKAVGDFQNDVLSRLQNVGEASAADWQTYISNEIANQSEKFLTGVKGQLAQHREQFVSVTPIRLLGATSRAMARHGLRVARGLLSYVREDLDIAGRQLQGLSTGYREDGRRSKSRLASVFVEAPRMIPADHDLVRRGVRAAARQVYLEAHAERLEWANELMLELQEQVIDPLVTLLRQIEEGLGHASEVQQWPGDYGVPPQLAPPPLEFCLVESDAWPQLYVDLVSASASHDQEEGTWGTILRTMVGAGGFTVNRDGFEHQVETAIELKKGDHWSPRCAGGDGMSVKFEKHYEVGDVVARAREWITREGTAMGDFLNQGLMEYLNDTSADGRAIIDHQARLNDFEQKLNKVLIAASPLVNIDEGAALIVHPGVDDIASYTREMERMPLAEGHPAYSLAKDVIERTVFGSGASGGWEEKYFGSERRGVESVTCVSYLNGAVHPAAITSLMSPIAQAWNSSTDGSGFWMRRRARSLSEFVPVHPDVLRSMIRGWITGRMLDLIPAPDPDDGFSIRTAQGLAHFPWPTIKGNIPTTGSPVSWLPALLESIPLAFAQFATKPTVLDAYDELYLLGQMDRSGASKGSPGRDYQLHPGIEIMEFIDRGAAQNTEPAVLQERFEPQEPNIASPEEERKHRLLNYLAQFQETLQNHTETDINQDNIWKLPDGMGLFGEIGACTQEMINTINHVDTASPGEVG